MARKGGKTYFEEWLSVVNGSAAYGNRYPGVWYSWREEKIIVVLALNGNPERWLRIPAGDLIARDKTTSFKISQEYNKGKLMFKVNFSLNSVPMQCPMAPPSLSLLDGVIYEQPFTGCD